jgi:glycosyltransferase involved in cell wall biosynthesis
MHWLRLWDLRTAYGVDIWVANSENVAQRIRKTYRREALVIYPPVATAEWPFSQDKEDYYLTCSRLVPYKRIDLIVEAFCARPKRRLLVAGDGPDAVHLKQIAGGAPNIEFLGRKSDVEIHNLMKGARALIFASNEDFGIVPVEAQACGTPVIAYAKGGALETVRGLDARNPTGVFFLDQSAEAINGAIDSLEQLAQPIDAANCRANADRFNSANFRASLLETVRQGWAELSARTGRASCDRPARSAAPAVNVVPARGTA